LRQTLGLAQAANAIAELDAKSGGHFFDKPEGQVVETADGL
jgi:hypothetical protein